MNKYRRFLPDALIVLLLFGVPLVFFWQQTLGGRTLIPAENLFLWQPYKALAEQYHVGEVHNALVSDLILQYYTWRNYAITQISQGQIPLWQPNILAGTPFLGAGQPQMAYPLSLIYLISPLWLAFGWYVAIHVGLAGLNVYIFGQALRMRRAGSVVAALVYQLSGFILATIAFPTILGAAAWLPLGLAMVEKVTSEDREDGARSGLAALRGKTVLWVIVGAIGLGMASLAGHVEAMYFSVLVMSFFAGWRLVTSLTPRPPLSREAGRRPEVEGGTRKNIWLRVDWRRVIGRGVWLGAMIGLGMALGSAQIVPAYEMATRSFREGTVALDQVKEWAYPPRQILAFLMPNFFGNPTHHQIFDVFAWRWTPVTANATGSAITTTEWGIKNYVEGAAYVGILPLILAGLGVIGWARGLGSRRAEGHGGTQSPGVSGTQSPGIKNPRLRNEMSTEVDNTGDGQYANGDRGLASPLGFIVLSLLSLSFVFGTPTYDLLYYGLPFFNQSHSPFRWVWPMTLCIAMLAGYGIHYLTTSAEGAPSGRTAIPPRLTTFLGGGGVALGLLTLIGLAVIRSGYNNFAGLAALVESIFSGMALAPNAFPDAKAFFSYEAINIGIMGLMLVASGGAILLARALGTRRITPLHISLWQAAATIVIIADLFIGSWGLTPASDPQLLSVMPPSIQWLKDRQAEAPGQPFRFIPYIAPGSTKTMNANTGWLNGLEDVTGYDSLLPAQYVNYMKLIMPQGDLPYNRVAPIYEAEASALDSPLLDLLGVRYIMSESPINNPKWTQVYQDDALRIYENSQVMPRAFTMPASASRLITGKSIERLTQQNDIRRFVLVDGACAAKVCPLDGITNKAQAAASPQPAAITVYKSGETWIDADMNTAGWLIVADSYYPGWRAWIRPIGAAESAEKETPVYLVDGNFKGVRLEPGRWTVRMKYSPDSVKFGLLGALLSTLALVFLLGVWAWPRLYREEGTGGDAKRVAKNALTPILLNLFTKGILFALTFVSLRVLGPAGTGDYTYAVVIWGWFDIFTNFGLNTYLTREVARHKDQASRILASTTLLRLGLALLGIPALAGFIAFRQAAVQPPLNNETIITLWLLYGGLFFSTISTGLTALFYAYEKAEFPAAIQTISAFLTAAFGISALLIGFGIIGLAAVSVAVNAITFAILGVLAVRMFSLTRRPPLPEGGGEQQFQGGAWAAIRESWPLMINHLLATLFFRIDVVLLEALKGATVVGWYRVVYTWVDAIGVIPSFFTLSLFPVMSRQAADDKPALKRAYVLAVKLMTLVSIPTAIFTTLLATVLVSILGGAQYLPNGAIALQIFIWAMIVGWMNSVTQYVIIALDRQRTLTIAFVIGAAFNIIANLIFIPLYSYVASSVITILSEMVLWVVFTVILTRDLGRINWAAALWRIGAAGVLCAGVTFGLAAISTPLALVAGVMVYGVMLAVIRPLDAEESKLFVGLLPEGIRRRVGARFGAAGEAAQ